MSDKRSELPRDLRGLCGGYEVDADGSYRVLLNPVKAYANVVAVRREMERDVSDPATNVEDLEFLGKRLKIVRQEEFGLKQRILNHFKARPPNARANDECPFPSVDHDAKSKMEKAIKAIEAGTYNPHKISKTLLAVFRALDFNFQNRRMPSHLELKALGFNDQQATDAGKWLDLNGDSFPDSIIGPLHQSKQGRRRK